MNKNISNHRQRRHLNKKNSADIYLHPSAMTEGRVNELCAKTGMMAMVVSGAYVKLISRERFRSRPHNRQSISAV